MSAKGGKRTLGCVEGNVSWSGREGLTVTAHIAFLPFGLLMIFLADVILPPINVIYGRAFKRQPTEIGSVINAHKRLLSEGVGIRILVAAVAIALIVMSLTISVYFGLVMIALLVVESLLLTAALRRTLASMRM
jgi:hypothetical protein